MNHPTTTAAGGQVLTTGQADHLVALVSDLSAAALQRGRALARTDLSEAQRDEVYGMWARATDAAYAAIRDLERLTGPAVSGSSPAGGDRFTVFAGPDGWAWAEGWTAQGHSVLATGCRWVADAVPVLRAANPGAVITTAALAEGAEALALAAAGGHFAVDADPACAECARLSRPVVDGQDHDGQDGGEVEWCRLCDEQPAQLAPGDGLCGFCRGDVAEGRVIDPDAGSTTDTVLLGVSGLGIVFGAVGVLVGAWHLDAVTVTAALATLGAYGWLAARMHGICRTCGHPGSAGSPLTVLRRPRVHTRHLPNIRASRRNSRLAARAARDDAAGGVR